MFPVTFHVLKWARSRLQVAKQWSCWPCVVWLNLYPNTQWVYTEEYDPFVLVSKERIPFATWFSFIFYFGDYFLLKQLILITFSVNTDATSDGGHNAN
jgi:hypothetical protein